MVARNWKRPVVIALSAMLCIGGASSGRAETTVITLPNEAPMASTNRSPSTMELLQTWLSGFYREDGKQMEPVQFEILDRQLGGRRRDRILLKFRVHPTGGPINNYALMQCPKNRKPVEIQIVFVWQKKAGEWVGLYARGIPAYSDPCLVEPLWTKAELAMVLNPPSRPKQPSLSQADITSPPEGSPEREAILVAMKSMFEEQLGQKVTVTANELRVSGNWAWATVAPRKSDGSPFGRANWKRAYPHCELGPNEASAQMWMHKQAGQWRIGWPGHVCATDVMAPMGCYIGAPMALWAEDWRSFMQCEDEPPAYDKPYFDFWLGTNR